MLIPIRHENMSARRWPVITLGLIAVNVIVFLGTHWSMDAQPPELGQLKLHIILLAAAHPDLTLSPKAQELVNQVRQAHPDAWKMAQNPDRQTVEDGWDAKMRIIDDPRLMQAEMDNLGEQYAQLHVVSLTEEYGFVPAHRSALSYVTANFLHGGWLHLIGNMWFLWLAGFVLEDNWGRVLYAVVYFVAGAAALQIQAVANPGSLVPTIGASGAVAALMGAFLVRFPKMKIEMRWILGIRSLLRGGYQFSAPAYWLLPLWLLMEVFYGSLFGQATGVAHWAHVGGFAFGAIAALLLNVSGLEHTANQAIEEKTTWNSEKEITEAGALIERGQFDEATALLKNFLLVKPDSTDGNTLLPQIYWRKSDLPAFHEITAKLCALHLRARETALAWQNYEEFLTTGGGKMPAAVWFDLCRAAETQQNFDRALKEYQKLAETYPAERQALMAQMAAARIYLKQLNRPQEALQLFEATAASPIPHLDLDMTIQVGIRDAKKASAVAPAFN